jgi:hypothetical protein
MASTEQNCEECREDRRRGKACGCNTIGQGHIGLPGAHEGSDVPAVGVGR